MMQLIKPDFNQYTVNIGFCKIKTMLQIYCLLNACFQLDYRLCFIYCSRQRALHYSVVMKRELSKKAKLSIFKAVFVPILTYCMVVNRGYDQKRAIASPSVRNEAFTKSKDTF